MSFDPASATDPQYAARFARQDRFAPLGSEGGERLRNSRVLICGCGALGTMLAERLARAGVGSIRIVDRDWVELSNLPRQTLFTERDALESRPKAIAAAEALAAIDSRISLDPRVLDITCDNIGELARDCHLLLDGTDNFETRFLLNDYSQKWQVPWVHGGCVGSGGQVMSIVPGQTACFRCLVPDLPSQDAQETCDSAGVLGPAIGIIASWQAAEAMKILSGRIDAVCRDLLVLDCWETTCRKISLAKLFDRRADCPACGRREFPYLEGKLRTETLVLCGKNAVQVRFASGQGDWDLLRDRLQSSGQVVVNRYFLRLTTPPYVVTLFRDGRAVVEGTTDVMSAKNIITKTLGG